MNTKKQLNNILNKFPKKTELANQKIELALIDEIAKFDNDASNILKEAKAFIQDAKSRAKVQSKSWDKMYNRESKIKQNAKRALGEIDKANNILSNAEKAAKELGVNVSGIRGYNELEKLISRIKETNTKINQANFI